MHGADYDVSLPRGRARGGLVPLHPADDPSRRQPLFDHLAEVLPPRGIAVLRFDRRPAEGLDDVPFSLQAEDALAAVRELRSRIAAPVGLWAWSQGTWAAAIAAAEAPDEIAFLALIASPGVSPARQMRYGTAEQLKAAGYGPAELAQLAQLREQGEEALRRGDHAGLQAVVERYADRPWFPLAYVPYPVTPDVQWTDMDFDPEPYFRRVHCPVLLFYGETDEWTPIDESIEVWRRAKPDVEVVRLAGATHAPKVAGEISPDYERELLRWLDRTLPAAA